MAMIHPAIGARYFNRRTQRQMTLISVQRNLVRLMDGRGYEWMGSIRDFWEIWVHADTIRSRQARWRHKQAGKTIPDAVSDVPSADDSPPGRTVVPLSRMDAEVARRARGRVASSSPPPPR